MSEFSAPGVLATPRALADNLTRRSPTMSDATDGAVPPTETERILHSLGNHLTLIETHADHIRRQLALLAIAIEAAKA